MVDATELFNRPARGMCQIYSTVLQIFFDNFKTFAILALLQALVFIPVFIVFFIVAFAAFATEIAVLSQTMNNGVRRLYESSGYDSSSSGSGWGTSTTNYSPTTIQTTDDLVLPPGFWGFLASVLGLYIAFLAAAICISAAFQGAFIRAASEVFAGRSPNWQTVLQIGRNKTCSIICFGLLYLAGTVVAGGVWFAVTLLPMLSTGEPHFGTIFLSILVFVVAYFAFSLSMTGGVTCIMVENKSAVAAMGRSWKLCSPSICFIFCCIFCFYVMEMIGQSFAKNILVAIFVGDKQSDDPTATLVAIGAANWIMSLLLGPLNATLNPVIYFSLRIQKEGLTMEELQGDLALLEDCIELRTGDGIYSKVGNSSKLGSFTPPVAQATAV